MRIILETAGSLLFWPLFPTERFLPLECSGLRHVVPALAGDGRGGQAVLYTKSLSQTTATTQSFIAFLCRCWISTGFRPQSSLPVSFRNSAPWTHYGHTQGHTEMKICFQPKLQALDFQSVLFPFLLSQASVSALGCLADALGSRHCLSTEEGALGSFFGTRGTTGQSEGNFSRVEGTVLPTLRVRVGACWRVRIS